MVTKSFVIGQCIAHPELTTKNKSQYLKRIKKNAKISIKNFLQKKVEPVHIEYSVVSYGKR